MKEIKRLKNVMLLAATFFSATSLHGASIGFFLGELDENGSATTPDLSNWNGCLTYFYVVGQKDLQSRATIQDLLNDGNSGFADYAIGSATVDQGHVVPDASALNPRSLGPGTYTAFAVLFDAKSVDDITVESTKYLVLAGSKMTQTIQSTDYVTQFSHTSAGTLAAKEDYWGTFGVVPEPTSGVMLLLGVAALALKRKRG